MAAPKPNEDKEIYEFGPFRLDIGEHLLERLDGAAVNSLPEKAFQTLSVLVRNSGHLMSKEDLLELVWPDSFVEANNLDKSIHAIRSTLGERSGEQKYIETVRKHGYRFVAEVRRPEQTSAVNEAAPEHSPAADEYREPTISNNGARRILRPYETDQAGPGSVAAKRATRQKVSYLAAAVALLGVLGLAAWYASAGRQTVASVAKPEAEGARGPSAEESSGNQERSPAYDLYIRGKVKAGNENRQDTEAAIELLERATAADPNFAPAHAQLARAYNNLAFKYSADAERKRFHENAEVAVEKALALDPNLAEAHFARGLILWTNTEQFPHELAIQAYKRSIALDPKLDEAHHQLSFVYSHIGLLDEAETSVKRALELNPNNTMARFRVGVYKAYQGKFQEAVNVFKTVPRDETPLLMDRCMAEALIQLGRLQEAEAIADDYLRQYPKDEGGSMTGVKALILARRGRPLEALETIERAVEIGAGYGHFHHTAYNAASVYAVLSKPEEAMKWLENAASNGFPNYPYFEVDPNLANIRDDPRFTAFTARLKPQLERYKQADLSTGG